MGGTLLRHGNPNLGPDTTKGSFLEPPLRDLLFGSSLGSVTCVGDAGGFLPGVPFASASTHPLSEEYGYKQFLKDSKTLITEYTLSYNRNPNMM